MPDISHRKPPVRDSTKQSPPRFAGNMDVTELIQAHWTKLASIALALVGLSLVGFFDYKSQDIAPLVAFSGMSYFYWVLLELHFKKFTIKDVLVDLKNNLVPSIIVFSLIFVGTHVNGRDLLEAVYFLTEIAASVFYVKAAKVGFIFFKNETQKPAETPMATGIIDCPVAVRSEAKVAPSGPKGVGGWLLFFCVTLTIISPLFTIGTLGQTWQNAKPAIAKMPSLETYYMISTIGTGILLLYGFAVGCLIWTGDPDGKKLAKRYLVLSLGGVVLVEVVSTLFILDLPPRALNLAIEASAQLIFVNVVRFVVWWLYFKKSKRVANTYPESV